MKKNLVFETPLPAGLERSVFEKALMLTYAHLGFEVDGQVHLSFVTKKQSKTLNKVHTGNDYPTDVLSFSYPPSGDSAEIPQVVSEIVICTPIAENQAKQYNESLNQEACLLFVHGLIHSLGHDHQTKQSQSQFETIQNDIMKQLGLTARNMPWSQ